MLLYRKERHPLVVDPCVTGQVVPAAGRAGDPLDADVAPLALADAVRAGA